VLPVKPVGKLMFGIDWIEDFVSVLI
jgi:hypothetical protein